MSDTLAGGKMNIRTNFLDEIESSKFSKEITIILEHLYIKYIYFENIFISKKQPNLFSSF